MLVMAVHQTPSLTREKYEQVIQRLSDGKTRLDSISDLPFDGILGPIAAEVGIEEPPEFFPAHTFV